MSTLKEKRWEAKELQNLRRNRTKKYHEFLNQWAMTQESDSTGDVFFLTLTGLNQRFSTPEEAWKEWNKLHFQWTQKLFSLDMVQWGVSVSEKHLPMVSKEEKEHKEEKTSDEKDNKFREELENYPHAHILLGSYARNFTVSKKQHRLWAERIIHQQALELDTDMQLKTITSTRISFKKTLQYVIKDQRNFLQEKVYEKEEIIPVRYKVNHEIEENEQLSTNALITVLNFPEFSVEPVEISSNSMAFVYQNNFSSFVAFLKRKLKEHQSILFRGSVLSCYQERTFLPFSSINSQSLTGFLTMLYKESTEVEMDFVQKFRGKFLKEYEEHPFLDEERFNYQYIELKDVFWFLPTNKFLKKNSVSDKEKQEIFSFKYLELTSQELLAESYFSSFKKALFGLSNSIGVTDQSYQKLFRFLYSLGRCVVLNKGFGKGSHVYISGKSNSGKSTFVEHFYVWLFGAHNVGVLGKGNFGLEPLLNKRVVIVNEFKYDTRYRETLLKLLDCSVIHVQKKHQSNVIGQVDSLFYMLSNIPFEEQGFDKAMENRLNSLTFQRSFEELGITFEEASKEFPYILFMGVLTYTTFKDYPESEFDSLEFARKYRDFCGQFWASTLSKEKVKELFFHKTHSFLIKKT